MLDTHLDLHCESKMVHDSRQLTHLLQRLLQGRCACVHGLDGHRDVSPSIVESFVKIHTTLDLDLDKQSRS